MTHTKDEALKLALEALEFAKDGKTGWTFLLPEAITAIKQALAAPVQEPVAWTVSGKITDWSKDFSAYQTKHYTRPVYTPPAAQRQRVVFPTMLRKMWSGGEVQKWLDENVNTIDMAREAGFETMLRKGKILGFDLDGDYTEELKAFEALVRADERAQGQKWFDAVTAQHKQEILAEREACAKWVDHILKEGGGTRGDAIRARKNT